MGLCVTKKDRENDTNDEDPGKEEVRKREDAAAALTKSQAKLRKKKRRVTVKLCSPLAGEIGFVTVRGLDTPALFRVAMHESYPLFVPRPAITEVKTIAMHTIFSLGSYLHR